MGYSKQSLKTEMARIVAARQEEKALWSNLEGSLKPRENKTEVTDDGNVQTPIGTSVPALYSVFYKFIQNPSTVSVDTYKRMIDTDDTVGSGVDFLTTCLTSRLGRYEHKSKEITQWVNKALDNLDGGWYNKVKEFLSASWAGYFVGEKVWRNGDDGWVIDRIVPLPPTSLMFEVDREGRIEDQGILQYQRNFTPNGMNPSYFGGMRGSGFEFYQAGGHNGFLQNDPLSKFGDMAYPIRNTNSFMYMTVRIPRDKCVHYSFDSQGKMGNPYGRSILRRAFNAYVSKQQTMQMMLRALDRKGTPLMIVYASPNVTVKDPNLVNNRAQVAGQNVGIDAARSASRVFQNIHNDSVVTLPGKKGQIYDVDVIPMDAHADQFITVIQHFDKAILRSLLIPSLVFSSGDGGGAYALGQEHSKTFDKICDGYLEGLKQVIREQVIRPMLAYNFPRSAWEKDGIGDFTKLELSQDEKQKEAQNIETAVNTGILDLSNLADYNTAREKFGFEPAESVPDLPQIKDQEDGDIEPSGTDSDSSGQGSSKDNVD